MGIVVVDKILALVDNDRSVASALLQMFIDLTPDDYNNLQTGLTNNDIVAVGKAAHKMKSSIATMGMQELSDLVKSIEFSAKNNEDLETLPERIQQVGHSLNEVYLEMKDIIANQLA